MRTKDELIAALRKKNHELIDSGGRSWSMRVPANEDDPDLLIEEACKMLDRSVGEWHAWGGGDCPVNPDATVIMLHVKFPFTTYLAVCQHHLGKAFEMDWNHKNLVAYAVISHFKWRAQPIPDFTSEATM